MGKRSTSQCIKKPKLEEDHYNLEHAVSCSHSLLLLLANSFFLHLYYPYQKHYYNITPELTTLDCFEKNNSFTPDELDLFACKKIENINCNLPDKFFIARKLLDITSQKEILGSNYLDL